MSKEDLGKLIDNKKFSKTMYCYGDDKLGNFIKEIYFDGMREGYNLAKFRLELLEGCHLMQLMNIGIIIWKKSEAF